MRTLLIALLLIGCNRGGVQPLEIEDAEDVRDACEEQADQLETETIRVTFAGTPGGCPWGDYGNLQPEDGVLTARVEQVEALELEDVVICDMAFDFAGEAGLEQDIIYDDNFMFVFNGVVLAGSYRPWIDRLPDEGVFKLYDWDTIVGMDNLFDNDIPTYCVGEDSDLADCDIPPPETQGPISLSFDLEITSELSYMAIDESRAEFTFVATGDNDPSTDCSHREFFFEVTVPHLPSGGE
jgi:hypothetical protein